jgi:O-antigen/teichoic acid export membrane protein
MSVMFRNISSNMTLMVLRAVTTLMMTPIFIRSMGNYDYGVWELVGAIVGYMGLLDLGLSPAISRYIAKYKAEKNARELLSVYSNSIILLFCIGLLLGVSLIGYGFLFMDSIGVSATGEEIKYQYLFLIIGLQLVYVFPSITLVSVLEGYQLFHIKNNIVVVNSIIGFCVLYYFIDESNALLLVAFSGFVFQLVKNIYYFLYIKYKLPVPLHVDFRCLSKKTMKELLTFSSKSMVQSSTYRLSRYSDNMIIAAYVGTASIVYFSLAKALLSQVNMVVANVTSVFLPYFTELLVADDKNKLTSHYLTATTYTTVISFFFIAVVTIIGDEFIGLWVGADYAELSRPILYIFSCHGLVYLFNPFALKLIMAMNKHGVFAKISVIESILNIALSLVLVQFLGLIGVALGTLISCLVGKIIKVTYCLKLFNVTFFDLVYLPLKSVALSGFIPIVFLYVFQGRVNSYMSLLLLCTASSVIFLITFYKFTIQKEHKSYVILRIKNMIKSRF